MGETDNTGLLVVDSTRDLSWCSKTMNMFMRRLITAALFMSVLMTVLNAYIRLSDSGIGCEPWPACTNLTISGWPSITITEDDTNKYLRVLHRITASVFGIVAIELCVVSA